jgi:hypothetical protein
MVMLEELATTELPVWHPEVLQVVSPAAPVCSGNGWAELP